MISVIYEGGVVRLSSAYKGFCVKVAGSLQTNEGHFLGSGHTRAIGDAFWTALSCFETAQSFWVLMYQGRRISSRPHGPERLLLSFHIVRAGARRGPVPANCITPPRRILAYGLWRMAKALNDRTPLNWISRGSPGVLLPRAILCSPFDQLWGW